MAQRIEIAEQSIRIDGAAQWIFSGEVHYFRLARGEWEDRIIKAKQMGCTAIASYIPWLMHEPIRGQIDVTGRTADYLAIDQFIDLCHAQGLWFIARPGPFIMAEMKNEGIPYWVRREIPSCVIRTWDGEVARSKSLNVRDAGYLSAVHDWYRGVMPVLAERLITLGGPVIAVQLDNEIGMLDWVNNQPDLSEDTLCAFAEWIQARNRARLYPFDWADPEARRKAVRTPTAAFSGRLVSDYAGFERDRIAAYTADLRRFAHERGVRDVPFLINVHGTGGGRGLTYPIGLQQLQTAFTQDRGYVAGTDHYFGELSRENVADFVLMNAFSACVQRPEQPLTSLEFEVGSGDYGETGAVAQSGESTAAKVRLSLVQGNRLLNYYLLTGGRNPKLPAPVGDGNDRVAFTGERHGFAAPINPEGELTLQYDALRQVTGAMRVIAPYLADAVTEYDDLTFGFDPGDFETAYFREGTAETVRRSREDVRGLRFDLARNLLALGYRFGATRLDASLPNKTRYLVHVCGEVMAEDVQRRLVEFLASGGTLLLYGGVPTRDADGRECLRLAQAIGVSHPQWHTGDGDYHPSIQGEGWAEFEPEVRTWRTQSVTVGAEAEVWMRLVQPQRVVGFSQRVGRGVAHVLTSPYPWHRSFWMAWLSRFGPIPELSIEGQTDGVLIQTMTSPRGARALAVINLDIAAKSLSLFDRGQPSFPDEALRLGPKASKILPFGGAWGPFQDLSATGELAELTESRLVILPQAGESVWLRFRDSGSPARAEGANLVRSDGWVTVTRTSRESGPVQVSLRD
ncbi:MAG: beta-galactosidase [Fimbriimonadaceae bacterium]|nr:beta-galactosidase [Fimbriimonadaceae bacterium]